MIWNDTNIQRLVLDMAAQIQKTPVGALSGPTAQPIDLNYDLGMDSLLQMVLAAQVNEFFGIFQTSVDNYLLTDSVLTHWVKKIRRARQENDDDVVFLTSGTSGTPKRIRHSMSTLLQEARILQALLPRPAQVVSTVPSNHLYGFLYTVVLPALWQVPVVSLSEVNASTLRADSLVIGTPFTWEYMSRTLAGAGTVACYGVSSTAPLSASLFAGLVQAGVNLLEVYGSTDTGGIAFRWSPDVSFRLFSHVYLTSDKAHFSIVGENKEPVLVPDRIERVSEREIRVLGRLDGAIQLAGVNIYPAHIQTIIAGCPLVRECDLYAKAVEGQPQLFCSIRLRTHTAQTEKACLHWLTSHLNTPEIPRNIQFY